MLTTRKGRRDDEGIDQDDPFWLGYYDADDPGTVKRPFLASKVYYTRTLRIVTAGELGQ